MYMNLQLGTRTTIRMDENEKRKKHFFENFQNRHLADADHHGRQCRDQFISCDHVIHVKIKKQAEIGSAVSACFFILFAGSFSAWSFRRVPKVPVHVLLLIL